MFWQISCIQNYIEIPTDLHVLSCVFILAARRAEIVYLLTQIITDLPRHDEVISYPKMPSYYSDNEEPVKTINLTERLKIDHRVLI